MFSKNDFDIDFEVHGDRTDLHYALTPSAGEPLPGAGATDAGAAASPELATSSPAAPLEPSGPDTPSARPSDARRGEGRRALAEPAILTLITRPWAHVWINGEDAGNTPLFRRSVPSGAIRVRLQPEGTGPFRELTIRAEPGQSVSRNLDLSD
jgi:serine/threonine-protein kinase